MSAGPAVLHLGRRLHRADVHARPAFQAELHVNKRAVLNKADGRPRAQIHAPAAPNTFFPVNANHPDLLSTCRPRSCARSGTAMQLCTRSRAAKKNKILAIIFFFRSCQVFLPFLFMPPSTADSGAAYRRKCRSATAKRQLPAFPLFLSGAMDVKKVVAVQGVEPRTLRI